MSGKLRSQLGLQAPDDFYQSLIDAHAGLSDAQSELLNAKLVLLLANHIGDDTVLAEAIAAAREGLNTDV
ncbi:MAG: DUF2783 domain-containing protein [Alphaproteobacteria bacterium]|nr:DUF2783 domain-containing protein [Alphaproteobacteria bacterium]